MRHVVMRRLICTTVFVPLALLATSCSSNTSASTVNFAKALRPALAKQCVDLVPPMPGWSPPQVPFPEHIRSSTHLEKEDKMKLNALVQADILTVRREGLGAVYALTPAGKNALDSSFFSGFIGAAFCAGHYKLMKVVDYTVPGKNLVGDTTSDVTFTYSAEDTPAWAQSSGVQAAFRKTFQQRESTVSMVLKNDGWAVYGNLSLNQ